VINDNITRTFFMALGLMINDIRYDVSKILEVTTPGK
jgi:hypothetical protein